MIDRGAYMKFVKGDLVTRNSYNHDLLFRVADIRDEGAILHGEYLRLEADANLIDLRKVERRDLEKRRKESKSKEEFSYRLFRQDYQLIEERREFEVTDGYTKEVDYFRLPTKVLHLDGDEQYLKRCIDLYEKVGLMVHGLYVSERDMPQRIGELIRKIQPNILVLTGHDAYSANKGDRKDLRAYRHSKYFQEAVREARIVTPYVDELVIFAGACQSHFESLIRAGANFASSPARINIHALDPVYIVAKIAYTSFMEKVNVFEVTRNTLTGKNGLGGIETRGLLRIGMPFIPQDKNK